MTDFKIKLANLIVHIQGVYENLREYCRDYIIADDAEEDFLIKITPEDIQKERRTSEDEQKSDYYMEVITSLLKIAEELPGRESFLMHGAVVAWKEQGYIFTAPSGTGKTTHVRLWKKYLGADVEIVNGDKPVLAVERETVVAYGTPWAGKERLQKNCSVPIKGICFLRQAETNRIQKLDKKRALELLLPQVYIMSDSEKAGRTLELFSKLLERVPVYEFYCNISEEAVRCSFGMLTEKAYRQ